MSNYELIRNAILGKQQIFAVYDSHPRELCPHAIGTKNGRQQALFYQFGGSEVRALSFPVHFLTGAAFQSRGSATLPFRQVIGILQKITAKRRPV